MKTNKTLKRLAKIEALISDVSERYSSGASHIRQAFRDAKAAFARVKEAVTSGTKKTPPVKRKKAAVKKAAAKAPTAKAAKKSAPIKKATKKAAAKKTNPGPVKKVPAPVKKTPAPVQKIPAPVPKPAAQVPVAPPPRV
jgi:hypothetical protein